MRIQAQHFIHEQKMKSIRNFRTFTIYWFYLVTSDTSHFQDSNQAFRFMEGPGHCPMISKYGPSLSKAVGPVDPSYLVVKKSHFNKNYSSYSESRNSTKQKVHVGCQYSKTCLKQPLKKRQNKDLNKKW